MDHQSALRQIIHSLEATMLQVQRLSESLGDRGSTPIRSPTETRVSSRQSAITKIKTPIVQTSRFSALVEDVLVQILDELAPNPNCCNYYLSYECDVASLKSLRL
jgi:hypothetical protein